MNKALVSVIVPVYNVEEYLEQCIDSILIQTYKNLDIIVIDDGSTDSSSLICDRYEKKDQRIRVFHKENGGLSDARNYGLENARGDFVTFIDSDDYISKNMISELVRSLHETKSDIAVCDYVRFSQCIYVSNSVIDHDYVSYDNERALEDMLYQKTSTTSAWCKLYKKSLFIENRYPRGEICEDLDTTYKLYSTANKIVINNHVGYFYRQRENSIINSEFNYKRMKALDFCENINNYIKFRHPKICNAGINRKFAESIYILSQIPFSEKKYAEYRKICTNALTQTRKNVLQDKKSRIIFRVYACLSYVFSCNGLILLLKTKQRLHFIRKKI